MEVRKVRRAPFRSVSLSLAPAALASCAAGVKGSGGSKERRVAAAPGCLGKGGDRIPLSLSLLLSVAVIISGAIFPKRESERAKESERASARGTSKRRGQ